MTAQVLFVSGTDTGIGKTWVSAAWGLKAAAEGQRVHYYKPIQTGSPISQPPEDPAWVEQVAGGLITVSCGYQFAPPVTPWVADPEGLIQFDKIVEDMAQLRSQCDLLIVEGAGGLLVPISPSQTMVDLIQAISAPVMLVSHVRLGTINHTLLSLQCLAHAQITLDRVVINAYPRDLSQSSVSTQTLLPVLQHYLPKNTPVWTCYESSSSPKSEDLQLNTTT